MSDKEYVLVKSEAFDRQGNTVIQIRSYEKMDSIKKREEAKIAAGAMRDKIAHWYASEGRHLGQNEILAAISSIVVDEVLLTPQLGIV